MEEFSLFGGWETHTYRGGQGSNYLPKVVYDQMNMREMLTAVLQKKKKEIPASCNFYWRKPNSPELKMVTFVNNFLLF